MSKEYRKKGSNFEHYFTVKPGSKLKERETTVELLGLNYTFVIPSSVFGFRKGVDKATEILIKNVLLDGKTLLDLGCGFGIIGIVIKRMHPETRVFLSDINERAVRYAKMNAKRYNLDVDVRQGDGFECWEAMRFDQVLCNPPFAAGKAVWRKMIEDTYAHLITGGTLQTVAYHNKGGKSLEKEMERVFSNVTEIVKKSGIRVYLSRKI
ncbi:MAG: class I SAM-dependent methyltransferase [Thermotoga sp.]|nr:MAG: class I SAM-dependent methyltransferase [Thermotoga sp.]